MIPGTRRGASRASRAASAAGCCRVTSPRTEKDDLENKNSPSSLSPSVRHALCAPRVCHRCRVPLHAEETCTTRDLGQSSVARWSITVILECTPRGIRHLLQSRFPSESLLPPSLAISSVTQPLRRKKRLPIRRQRRPAPPAHTHCLVNPSVPALRSVSGRQSAAVVVLGVGGLPPLPAAGPLLSSICRSITMKGLYGPFCPGG